MRTATDSGLPKAIFGLALTFFDAGLLASAIVAPLAGWMRWTAGVPLAAATLGAGWVTAGRFRWWWGERRELDPYMRHLRVLGGEGGKR